MIVRPSLRFVRAAGMTSLALVLVAGCTAPQPTTSGEPTDPDTSATSTAEPSEPETESSSPTPTSSEPSSSAPTSEPSPSASTDGPSETPSEAAGEEGSSGPSPSQEPTQSSSPTGGAASTVAPVVSFAEVSSGTLVVNAHVPVVETGGTCVLTATRGANEASQTVSSFADATTTLCDPFSLPLPSPSRGTWTVEIAYSSPGSTGSTSVEVSAP